MKKLASSLPTIALSSRQSGTVKNYTAGFRKWKQWAANFSEVCTLPADPSLYLVNVLQNSNTHAPIYNAFYSISWAHQIAGLPDPTEHHLPRRVKEASIRLLGHGNNKKEPISPQSLSQIVNKFANESSSASDLRVATMCILAYAGFMRFDELSNILASDIVFESTYVRIFIERAKNDVHREGNWVIIAKTSTPTCPVGLLSRYIQALNVNLEEDVYLFRALKYLRKTKTYAFRVKNEPIKYTRAREIILEAFKGVGLDVKCFGTHSLRSGGATSAANNLVCDRLFKKHGRWRSEKAKDGYVSENIEQLLSVTLKLGI